MSTILKALRQLEEERTRASEADALTDPQLAVPLEPRRVERRSQRWQAALLAGVGGALLASALVLAWLPDRPAAVRPGTRLEPVSAPERAVVERNTDGVPLRPDGGLAPAAPASAEDDDAPSNVIAVFGANQAAAQAQNSAGSPNAVEASSGEAPRRTELAADTPGTVSPVASDEQVAPKPRPAARFRKDPKPLVVAARPKPAPQANSAQTPGSGSRSASTAGPSRASNGETLRSATAEPPGASANEPRLAAPTKARAPSVRRPPVSAAVGSSGLSEKAPSAPPNVADIEPMIPDFARSRVAGAATPVVVASTVWHPVPARRTANIVVSAGGVPREVREGEQVGSLVVLEITPSGIVFEDDGVRVTRRVGARD